MLSSKISGPYHNRLLASLSPSDLALLKPHLQPTVFERRHQLEYPKRKIDSVYFVEHGIASVVAVNDPSTQIEVGLIGREGASGMAVILGDGRTPHSTYTQVAGDGQRISTAALSEALAKSPTLLKTFLKFAHTFMIQTSSTAVANARATLDERLARWILMAHDRMDNDDIPLTHEFLALMMGTRRPGVTEAMHNLTERGLIKAVRALITVTDRKGLEALAGKFYGIPEAEYARLLN